MFLLWIGLIYFCIGIVWAAYVSITMRSLFESVGDALLCYVCNMLFWPLVMVLAVAMGRLLKGSGGH